MPDTPIQPELPIGDVDASGEAMGIAAHPEQPPMDDAAGPQPDDDQTDIDDTDTDDLTVQGGE